MSQIPPDPELIAFEALLGALSPTRSQLDRDALMFQAGAASVRGRGTTRFVWPAIAASLAAVVAFETAAIAVRPVRTVDRIVVVREPATREPAPERIVILSQRPESAPQPDRPLYVENEALRLRRQVGLLGLEGLPDPPPLLTRTSVDGPDHLAPDVLRSDELEKVINLGGPS